MELCYEAGQIQRVLDATPEDMGFLMKITSATTNDSTKWLSITREEVQAIRNMLQVQEISRKNGESKP